MDNFPDYYSILELTVGAEPLEIKQSFRHLAQIHHPDKNLNSPDSQLVFRGILEAYRVLSSAEERIRYDDYLRSSTVIKRKIIKTAPPARGADQTVSEIISRLNFILWEIEDLLADLDNEPPEIICILSFFDKWILSPSGSGDYFFTARQVNKTGIYNPSSVGRNYLHSPYVNLDDYFYQIRRRFDRFTGTLRKSDLSTLIPGTRVSLLDSIFESARLSYYYLEKIHRSRRGEECVDTKFVYSNSAFDEDGLKPELPERSENSSKKNPDIR